jgi:Fe-S-cluster containining protein
MEAAYPALASTPFLDGWSDEDIDRLAAQFDRVSCPALNEHGHCLMYQHRPLTCRSMGIPTDDGPLTEGACSVQTFVPIVRLPPVLRTEEQQLAQREAHLLECLQQASSRPGTEMPLPYAFLTIG